MTAGENSKIRNDIQALRALAVIAVVLCHMNPAWLPGGYLGVDVFFVISGFVITQMLIEPSQKMPLRTFWIRRIFRIVPAYMVMLMFVAFSSAILFLPENFDQFSHSWRKSLFFVSNQYFATYGDYFSPAVTEQPLLHTWSLAVEMQFYLFYPLLILWVVRLKAVWLLVVFTVIGLFGAQLAWELSADSSIHYYALSTRAPEFLVGGVAAVYASRLSASWRMRYGLTLACLGYLLLLFSLTFLAETSFSPVTALIACLGCAFVILADVREGALAAVHSKRGVLLIGALSYSIYLWHWPVLATARYMFGDIHWSVVHIGIYVVTVLFFAVASWKLVELRFQLPKAANQFANVKKLTALFLVAVSPAVFAKQVNRLVPALPVEFTRYADDSKICHGKVLENCVRGVITNPQFLLIGDSHAAQLNLAVEVAGKALGVGFEVISASSCVPLPKFNYIKLESSGRAACESQIQVVSEKLLDAKNIVLAGMWTYQLQDSEFPKALSDFLQLAEERQQKVWVMAQVPKLVRNPARQVRLQYLGINAPVALGQDWSVANAQLALQVKHYANTYWFDASDSDLFMNSPFAGGALIYHDDHHLNEVGATQYGILLTNLFQSAADKQ